MCVHPDGVTVASGQVKGHGDEAKVIVCRVTHVSELTVNMLLGSFSNDDGDGNKNVKKVIG